MKLKSRKVLVTGADGFIGSHLAEYLSAEGADVRAFTYYNSFGSWGWLDESDVAKRGEIEIVCGDIRDRGSVARAMEGIEVVFHLAALIGIPYSYQSPESYVETNVSGTLNVLEEARLKEAARVLVTSTSEVYGTAQRVPIDEFHPHQGQSPYSATKIGADRLAESYYRSFGVPLTIVRPFNTYGPRQSARAVIPTIITQLLGGSDEIKLGAITPTRDLVFVADTCRGFIELAKCDKAVGEEVNIATQQEISIGDLAAHLIKQINPSARVVKDGERERPEKSEVERLLGANEKLRNLTNWSPGTELASGLGVTIDWFRADKRYLNYGVGRYQV